VSVVVPNYNYARYIRQRLDSVCNQSFPIYEVIVLDDASTDASAEVIAEYIKGTDKDIYLIQNDENSGSVFRQWKAGVDRCNGDLVWIAEADDLADEEFLRELAIPFEDEQLVLAYCQSKQMDESGDISADSYIDYALGASSCCLTDYCRDGREEIATTMCIKNVIPNVSAVIFRRQALQEALEDASGRLYEMKVAGDWLVYLHTLLKGKVYHSKKSLNLHRRHTGSVTGSLQKKRHVEEIMQMQNLAISMVSPTDDVIRKADSYIDQVCEQFQIARPKESHVVEADAL
jgi:glycosyltransferase involved in cell wall biosynthesis